MNGTERREARYLRRKAAREAKRNDRLSQYDDFNRVTNFDNLYKALKECMRGVNWKESSQRFAMDAMRNTLETRRKLINGENIHMGYVKFKLRERGKERDISSEHIWNRRINKCLCNESLVPILTNSLIYDNGASVKGKGVHFALRRLICHLTKYYRQNKTNEGYALLVDFTKYFESVDHAVLFSLLDEKIRDKRLLYLTKSLLSAVGGGKSLGLGSQVSQICAIFLPNKLDHYIKEKLQIKFYGRYMDDLYLIHESKEYLKKCLKEIQEICGQLKLTINMKKTGITKLSQGMTFLKGRYSLLPTGRVLRRPGKESGKRMRRKLGKFKKLLDNKKMNYADITASYQSWRGNYKKRFDAFHRVRQMDKYYNELFIKEH